MAMFRRLSTAHLAVLLALLCALAFGSQVAGAVQGAFATHRTGTLVVRPQLTLSNGLRMGIAATIHADPGDVAHVEFLLHVPHGVGIAGLTFDRLANKEEVRVAPDAAPHAYRLEVRVQGADGKVVSVQLTVPAHAFTIGSAGRTGTPLLIPFRV